MISMIWPIAVIIVSNIFYHICTKSIPDRVDPFASLTVTYLVGAIVSAVMFFTLNRGGSLLAEYRHLNWTSCVLGLAIIGLEIGSIYMYKAGWDVSSGLILHSSIVAVLLVFVGALIYKETITSTKLIGVLVCLAGIYLINR